MIWTTAGIRRVREAIEAGRTAAEIAEAEGISIAQLNSARRRHNIPAPVSKSPIEAIKVLYDAGKTDEEIGAAVNRAPVTIRKIRHRHGWLRPNSVSTVNDTELAELVNRGLSDVKIARKMGIHEETVSRHRRALGVVRPGIVPGWNSAKPLDHGAIQADHEAGASLNSLMRTYHAGPARLKRILAER